MASDIASTGPGAVTAAIVIVYILLGDILYRFAGLPNYWVQVSQASRFSGIVWLIPASVPFVLLVHRFRARIGGARIRSIRAGWRGAWISARSGPFSIRRLVFAGAVLFGAQYFMNAFTAFKMAIPVIHPFTLDRDLARLDILLHGMPPHRLLDWVPLGFVEGAYLYAWMLMLLLCPLVVAWRGESRALLAIVLAWIILGTITATLFSSAGPIFYYEVTGTIGPYSDLVSRLHSGAAPATLLLKRMLWHAYETQPVAMATGISAFPSMHVALPALLTLITWTRFRVVAVVLGLFTVLTLIGSVALGWHYAVDGYASLIGAFVIYKGVYRSARPIGEH